MRRSAAPSRRLDDPSGRIATKSNLEILALLSSTKSSPLQASGTLDKIPEYIPKAVTSQPPEFNPLHQPAAFVPSPKQTVPVISSNLSSNYRPVKLQTSSKPVHRFSPQLQPSVLSDSSNVTTARFFACVWCKKSGRKHKKWEGDGFAKVGNGEMDEKLFIKH